MFVFSLDFELCGRIQPLPFFVFGARTLFGVLGVALSA